MVIPLELPYWVNTETEQRREDALCSVLGTGKASIELSPGFLIEVDFQ